jgi:hypothetical protein
MAFKTIVPSIRGTNRAIKGMSFRVARRGLVTFSEDLVADMGADSRTYIAFFINTDDNTLSFSVASEGNQMAKPFNPRTKKSCPNVFNAGIIREGAQLGRWRVVGKKDDIYLTDCPVGHNGE